jgi:hypothetical protein
MSNDKKYKLSLHAQKSVRDREINLKWLEECLNNPDKIEPDQIDGTIVHYLKVITDANTKVLRLVLRWNEDKSLALIITVFFDKRVKGKI